MDLSLCLCLLDTHPGNNLPSTFAPGNSYLDLKIWLRTCLLHRVFLREICVDLPSSTYAWDYKCLLIPLDAKLPGRQRPQTFYSPCKHQGRTRPDHSRPWYTYANMAHTHTHTPLHTDACTHTHLYTHMHTHTDIYTHIWTHTLACPHQR